MCQNEGVRATTNGLSGVPAVVKPSEMFVRGLSENLVRAQLLQAIPAQLWRQVWSRIDQAADARQGRPA